MRGIQILNGFWRDSGRPVRLAFMSAYVVGPLMLFLLYIRTWTFALLVLTIIGMVVIERFGFTPPVALLALRAFCAGKLVKRRRSMFSKRLDD